jgi:hypothetical protein
MTRYTLFGITIVLGLIASLYLGWAVRPVSAPDADPSLLREDFRADYALMVAESYAADSNLDRALEHLDFLDADNALNPVMAALEFGQEHGFAEADLAFLAALADALHTQIPSLAATPTP